MNLSRAYLLWSATAALLLTSQTSTTHAFVVGPTSAATASGSRLSFVGHLPMSENNSNNNAAAVVVSRLPDSAVEIQIPVPGTATKAAYDKVCTELSKTIQIPGFRKGSRIPPAVLEQSMAAKGGRNALKVQAINELLSQLLAPALKAESLEPIGQPRMQIPAEKLAETYKPGEPLTLSVTCDVWPEISWKGGVESKPYLGLTGKYLRKPFNQEKLDAALKDLRERYATLEPIEDSNHVLAMGDACTVNMIGYMATADGQKGEPLPNAASGDRVEVILGQGRYMEGLVEGLVGGKVGEVKTVHVSFPEKLRDKTLAGKRAVFDVEILEASKRSIPEVTDDFAQKVKPGLTAESLLAELRKAIDDEDAKSFVPARNKALAQALATVMDVAVPDTLVTNQAREKFAVMMAEMRDNGVADEEIKRQINPENFQKYKDIVKDDIIRDFKVSMATDEIARLEGITVEDYKVEEQMQAIKKDAAQSNEEFDEQLIRGKVENTLLRQAVMDWLAERANLQVEYESEDDAKFDEALLEKLAQESLEREQQLLAEKAAAAASAAESQGKKTTTASTTNPETASVKAAAVAEVQALETAATKNELTADKYAGLSLEEKAFQILIDTGLVQPNKSPNDPDYDSSADDQEAPAIRKSEG